MQVYGPAQVHGPQAISAPHTTRNARSASQVESPKIQDEVNISDAARLVEQAKQAPAIRQDRVQAIRAQIASGTYETSGKLGVAVERLLDEIG
jgi:flagellar biosynthesis anti-sigma factor FlgM